MFAKYPNKGPYYAKTKPFSSVLRRYENQDLSPSNPDVIMMHIDVITVLVQEICSQRLSNPQKECLYYIAQHAIQALLGPKSCHSVSSLKGEKLEHAYLDRISSHIGDWT
jgi:hypothetical protein